MIIATVTLVLAFASTCLVRELAHKFGFIAKPKSDRWHKRPTAMMGGVAMFATVTIVYLLFLPHTPQMWIVLGSSAVLFAVGLIDDILHIRPYQKLIGQLIGAAILIGSGLTLQWTQFEIVNIFITVFWLIGITNAINLLDNMDGLAAGITAIASIALIFALALNGQTNELLLVLTFAVTLIGFLRFNFNPATIFMGDCGSMFIGFLLASLVLFSQSGQSGQSRSLLSVLAIPVMTLFVPIFDTTFVTILRKLWGRSASQGGRDHTSHRLVALGLSERTAVLMLYAFAALAGIVALSVRELRIDQSLALISIFIIALTICGVYLGKVKVYEEQDEENALREKAAFGFLVDISHKRRIFEVILDVFLIVFAHYAAYALLFDSLEKSENWNLFLKALPFLIVLKLAAFLFAGVYRGIWRYTGIDDLFTFAKAVLIGSVLSVLAILLMYRFENYSRTVFVLDGLFLLMLLAGSRIAFRLFRQALPSHNAGDGRKILIYGADDGGELVLREIYNNPELNYNPIGFVDDDLTKKGKVIHGLRVLGGNGSIPVICRQHEIEEVLLSSRNINSERLRELRDECDNADVELKRASFNIVPVDEFI
ncbi:MAG: hypothetical protein H7Z37_05880 [Pyrinomonadaceae bacterium]|nr:hypothetical protein [Pyrinomonadaceae bacterium]